MKFLLAVLLLVAGVGATPAGATILVPLSDHDLAADAAAVVIGTVRTIESRWDPAPAQVVTHITLTVHEVVSGELPAGELTIKQLGGTVGGVTAWVHGSPDFVRGERVLLFLSTHPDGTARVAHLYQGKFSILADVDTGELLAYRPAAPAGVHLLAPPGTVVARPSDAVHELERFKARIRGVPSRRRLRARLERRPAEAAAPVTGGATQTAEAFTFLGAPSRWFEPDSQTPVTMYTHAAGEPAAPGRGFDQVRAALAAWSTGSAFRYADGGLTQATGFRNDGVNAISFGDPLNQMDPPVNCSGVLAIGGYTRTGETRTVNGTSFFRIVEGDVVGNSGWTGCGVNESFANMAEWLTHELGHVLGLGHSSDPGATMYARAHFDGRGASLRADDLAGLAFAYPGAAAPPPAPATFALSVGKTGTGTVTGPGIACGATCSARYAAGTQVTLTATAAAGHVFQGWSGAGCSGTGSCSVVLTADVAVSATFAATRADLVETSISAPPPSRRRQATFAVTDTTHNQGTAPAVASTTRYYLAVRTVRGPGDKLLNGVRNVPALGAGAASSGSVVVRVPLTTTPGTYYLLACADNRFVVSESNETNNCRASSARVTILP